MAPRLTRPLTLGLIALGSLPAADTGVKLPAPAFSGFVDTTYNYNLNAPASGKNGYRSFDDQANSFLLNAVQIEAAGKNDTLAYSVQVDAGSDARALTSAGSGTPDDVALQEAWLAYTVPGVPLTVKAGKFATPVGIEVIESGSNPTITRGFLFGLAEPYTHVGVLASYQIDSRFEATVGLVNGWDVDVDTNTGKTLVARLGANFGDPITAGLCLLYGPEQADDGSNRLSIDLTGISKVVPTWDLNFQINYGSEQEAALDGGDATWFGLALMPVWRPAGAFSLGGRMEYFDDQDGARTGVEQALLNLTVAPAYQATANLLIRAEARLDTSDEEVFEDSDGVFGEKNQVTLATEAILTF